MFDKIKQLQQMKQQMDTAKERLNSISVKGEYQGVTVVANGNKKITEVIISKEAYERNDREALAELVLTATNSAVAQAENVFESEMRTVAGGMMGGLGLF